MAVDVLLSLIFFALVKSEVFAVIQNGRLMRAELSVSADLMNEDEIDVIERAVDTVIDLIPAAVFWILWTAKQRNASSAIHHPAQRSKPDL